MASEGGERRQGWACMDWVVVGGQNCTRRTPRRPVPAHDDNMTYHGHGGTSRPRFMVPERRKSTRGCAARCHHGTR